MKDIDINFDKKTGYYDALFLSKWIATQWKTLDELIQNINESMSLSENQVITLSKFKISFEDKYVNF